MKSITYIDLHYIYAGITPELENASSGSSSSFNNLKTKARRATDNALSVLEEAAKDITYAFSVQYVFGSVYEYSMEILEAIPGYSPPTGFFLIWLYLSHDSYLPTRHKVAFN